jgi:hypothetical protein
MSHSTCSATLRHGMEEIKEKPKKYVVWLRATHLFHTTEQYKTENKNTFASYMEPAITFGVLYSYTKQ